jgi:hypothetical protein
MIKIIAWGFILFGTAMGVLCFFYGISKILKGETTFNGFKLLKYMNSFNGTLKDFSGTEILFVGILLFLATGFFYYLVFFIDR